MYNADIMYNYTFKYMILRQSILSIDKIFKEITVSECENAKIFKARSLRSLAYSQRFLNVSVLSVFCRL